MIQYPNKRIFAIAFFMLFSLLVKSQEISLSELQNFTSQSTETANSMLLTKGWEFMGAKNIEKGTTIVRWEFPQAETEVISNLIELSTFDKQPNSVRYQFNKKDNYLSLMSQFSVYDYKLIEDKIADQIVSATYASPNFSLILNYKRVTTDGKEFTSYEVTVTQKSKTAVQKVIVENNSDKKREFDAKGVLISEYFIKDGKREGPITYFFPDGTVKKEAIMKAGLEQGLATLFEYDPKEKKLVAKTTGTMLNDKPEGIWLKNKITENTLVPIEMTTYEEGLKQGEFQSIRNDSVVLMRYKNDMLEGDYRVFIHQKPNLKITEIDTTQMTRIVHGFFVEDKKIGLWKYFDTTGSLTEEGYLLNNAKTGVWKYYYPSTASDANIPSAFSGKLYLEETYKATKRNGECNRYSILKKEEFPCTNAAQEKCYRYAFEEINEKATLVNDVLNGDYELKDANNNIISKGPYLDGKPNGKWILRNDSRIVKRSFKTVETGLFQSGVKIGKWERTDDKNQLLETYIYKEDRLDGDYFLFQNNSPVEKWRFENNNFAELAVIGSDNSPVITYVLIDSNGDSYTCQKSEKNPEGICVKTFKVKNPVPKEENIFSYKTDFEAMPADLRILNGPYSLKNQQNSILEEGVYTENQKAGKWTTFYYDQNIQTNLMYENGIVVSEDYFDLKKNEPFSGEFIFKEKNSEMVEERKIKDGVRHGTTRFKDSKDKTIKKESYKKGVLKE